MENLSFRSTAQTKASKGKKKPPSDSSNLAKMDKEGATCDELKGFQSV